MATNKTFVDASLARGLAKTAVRTAVYRDDDALLKVRSSRTTGMRPKGRAAGFRHGVDLVRRKSTGGIAIDRSIGTGVGKKSDQHVIGIWDATDIKTHLALGLMWLRSRDLAAVDYVPLLVSWHASQRVFERIGTTEIADLEAEFKSATMLLIRLWACMTRPDVSVMVRQRDGVTVPTRNGALFVQEDSTTIRNPRLVATTWVPHEKLRREQKDDLVALEQGVLQLRDRTNVVTTRASIPLEDWSSITVQMELYGRTRSMRF